MLYVKINLKSLVRRSNLKLTKLIQGYPMRFLDLSLCTRTYKSVLVSIFDTVKKLFESKSVIFSYFGRY